MPDERVELKLRARPELVREMTIEAERAVRENLTPHAYWRRMCTWLRAFERQQKREQGR